MTTNINRLALPGIILICLFYLVGCSSVSPSPRIPLSAPAMIKVEGQSVPAVTFSDVVTDMPGGRIIGYHYEGMEYIRAQDYRWGKHFTNQTLALNSLGQDILGEAGYRHQTGEPGALRMVGTMAQFKYNTYARKTSFDQAECEMNWELFKAGQSQPVFSLVTTGSGRVAAGETGALAAAFELALRQLVASPEFAAAVKDACGS